MLKEIQNDMLSQKCLDRQRQEYSGQSKSSEPLLNFSSSNPWEWEEEKLRNELERSRELDKPEWLDLGVPESFQIEATREGIYWVLRQPHEWNDSVIIGLTVHLRGFDPMQLDILSLMNTQIRLIGSQNCNIKWFSHSLLEMILLARLKNRKVKFHDDGLDIPLAWDFVNSGYYPSCYFQNSKITLYGSKVKQAYFSGWRAKFNDTDVYDQEKSFCFPSFVRMNVDINKPRRTWRHCLCYGMFYVTKKTTKATVDSVSVIARKKDDSTTLITVESENFLTCSFGKFIIHFIPLVPEVKDWDSAQDLMSRFRPSSLGIPLCGNLINVDSADSTKPVMTLKMLTFGSFVIRNESESEDEETEPVPIPSLSEVEDRL